MSSKVLDIATQVMVMAIVISVILLFVGIGVLIIIHVCIVGRAFRRGFGSSTIDERGDNRSNSMSHDDLEKLPSFDFQVEEEKGSSPLDCAVCLENFNMGEKCRLLPFCKHSFHAECVDSWLLKRPFCPICRASAHFQISNRVSLGDDGSSSHSGEVGIELRGSQAVAAVGNQTSFSSSPLPENSPSEHAL